MNFAVDGYSMAQAFLRYQEIRHKLRYDVAILMFVPEADLWRDVNTLRQLYEPSWEAPLVPRFELAKEGLRLVPAFYQDPFDLYRRNANGLSDDLRQHLRAHDRLYFSSVYDERRGLERSLWLRLASRYEYLRERRSFDEGLMRPDGEALQVTQKIGEAMQQEVRADGAAFVLLVLPTRSLWWNGWTPADLRQWRHLVDSLCLNQTMCVDLLPTLQAVDPAEVDRVYDREHFGPKMNAQIANAVFGALVQQSLVAGTR